MKKFITAIVLGWVMVFLLQFNTFDFIEDNLSDRLTMKTRPVDPKIKIIAIDAQSLDKVGQWPWSRDQMAALIDKLAANGAKAVWVDVLYTQKSATSEEDKALANVIAKYHNVYLPVYFEFKALQNTNKELRQEYLKLPIFDIAKDRIGHINFLADSDNVVRKALLGIPDLKDEIIPSIDVKLANVLLPQGNQITWNDDYVWHRGDELIPIDEKLQVRFAYASSPTDSKFDVIPAWKVILGEVEPSYFRDSIVMVGPYAKGIQDQFVTSAGSTSMSAVEIHANIVQALVDNKLYSKSSNAVTFLIVVLGIMLLYALFNLLGARIGAIILAFLIIGYSGIVYYFYHTQLVLLPYFYSLLAFILAYLAAIGGHYLKERKEKNRVTGIFTRYLPKPVVEDIILSKELIEESGCRKDVTLMFVDIRDFTPLAQKMEPKEVIKLLNEYLDTCTKAIFNQKGTLDKYMGDGVMSIFGAPITQADHAERAVRAALEIKRQSRELAKSHKELCGQTIYFGIGINSGPAVIGNIGSTERLDYTAIGDAVNLASRLESAAKPGQILISRETYELIKDSFECTRLDPIAVNGSEKRIDIYQVEWEYDEDDDDDDDFDDVDDNENDN